MYKEYKGLNLPEIDKDIQKFWDTEGVFEKSVTQRDPNNAFVFYEGPPSANGLPGIHHVMARTIKDIFCRFQTLNGKRVERKGGWDTHGLPIELAVEKELGITKEDIGKKISVDDYNHKCREVVMRYKDLWDDITRKMGYWVDLDNPYVTYENAYIESVWFLLKRLYEKDYLYKGYTIQPFSPAAGTGLSSHELNMPGAYKDIKDTSVTAQFEIKDATTLPSQLLGNAFYTEGVLQTSNVELQTKNTEGGHQTSNVELQTKNTEGGVKSYFVAWTTTPWTLPSNCALVVGGNLDYAAVESFNSYTGQRGIFILAKALVAKNFDSKGENGDLEAYKLGDKQIPWRVLGECKGADLEGITYHQLMPYVEPNGEKAFLVLLGDFVTTEDGTGIVHTAALFGADDFKITKATGTAFITVKDDVEVDKDVPLVNKLGRFVKEVTDFAGEYVKEQYLTDDEKEAERERLGLKKYLSVDERIAIKLKTENKAFKVERYNHNYPHCWRTDKPILYYPLDSWFIAASRAKERMFELNKTINWKPAATGEGRFGKWLENLQDWNLSRSRYWGIGLPIWRTAPLPPEGGDETTGLLSETPPTGGGGVVEKCIGSIAELQQEINWANDILGLNQTVPKDLHRPYIDDIILVAEDGRPMKRELDLIDVWFDSGSMPYAQWGLDAAKLAAGDEQPFKAPFHISYPADFIAEGVDQTRGWFYTLHAIAVMAYDSVAFKNVMSNGLVQDKNGQKMSKSKGNAVDPFTTIAKHGADATRWYMISNAQPWDNLKFDEDGITETRNKFFGTLYNSYNFFAMYANVDGFVQDEMNQTSMSSRIELDKWILSKLHSLVGEVTELYAAYEPTLAARAIEKFVDADFSNWYVRLSRRRFWKGDMSEDKKSAYETMYQCLMVTAQLSAPIAPYFSDWMYKNLTDNIRSKAIENNTPLKHPSVHLSDLTTSDKWLIDKDLEQRMDYAQRISSLILSLRKKEKIRVRQPLSRVLLPIVDSSFIAQVEKVKDLILSETNVKAFEYITDASGVVTKKIKPNFKTLGKTLGANMKFAQAAIEALTQADIAQIEKEKTINLTLNGQEYPLSIDDFLITSEDIPGWLVANDGDVTVALDVTLTDELIAEGTARDLVNKIQNLRKDRDFNITDKIIVKMENNERLVSVANQFSTYIKDETLALDIVFVENTGTPQIEINDEISVGLDVSKAGFISVDMLQKTLAEKIFSHTESPKKASGRALGVLVEIITFYLLEKWGLNRYISIERGLAEFGSSDIKHNVEFSLHPLAESANYEFQLDKQSITSNKVINKYNLDVKGFTKTTNNLLDSHQILRNGCTIAASKDAYWLCSLNKDSNNAVSIDIYKQFAEPFAIFECKRVGVEEGQKKGPQTIEKAKQGAYVANSVSSLQKIRTETGERLGLVYKNDGSHVIKPYADFLEEIIFSEDSELLKRFILTVGVLSNHGNWFTAENHNKELKVLAQSYDWLLFLTDSGLSTFIDDLLLNPKTEYMPIKDVFMSSNSEGKKKNQFTKVQMNLEVHFLLKKYFSENSQKIESWFNVISPSGKKLSLLKEELIELTHKNWKNILK